MVLDNTAPSPHERARSASESLYLLPSLLYCMDYIDTQGMTLPSSEKVITNIPLTPMPVKKMTVFTDMEREELKDIIREVLHE